jgi:hypothetical protein
MRARAFVFLLGGLLLIGAAWSAYVDSWVAGWMKLGPFYVPHRGQPRARELSEAEARFAEDRPAYVRAEKRGRMHGAVYGVAGTGLLSAFGWECRRALLRRRGRRP